MSVPSTGEPQKIPVSQVTRGLSAGLLFLKATTPESRSVRDESEGEGRSGGAPLQRKDGEVPGKDRDAKNAKLAATRGYARLGDLLRAAAE